MTITAKEFTREDMLKLAVADETGFPLETVGGVYDLMSELEYHTACLKVSSGKVTVGWWSAISWEDEGEEPEIELPLSLWDRIEGLEFEIVELLDPILRAWQETFGHPFPTVFVFGSKPPQVTQNRPVVQ